MIIAVPETIPVPRLPERSVTPLGSQMRPAGDTQTTPTECAFVGSKKSNKYHAPTSRCAKQIKAENRLCFVSVEAATAKGYLPGCLE